MVRAALGLLLLITLALTNSSTFQKETNSLEEASMTLGDEELEEIISTEEMTSTQPLKTTGLGPNSKGLFGGGTGGQKSGVILSKLFNPTDGQNGSMSKKVQKMANTFKDIMKERIKVEQYRADNNLTKEDIICKPEILNAFGIAQKVARTHLSTSADKRYCRRNNLSCCVTGFLEKTRKTFQKGIKELNKKFEIIEELLVQFKGKMFKKLMKKVAKYKECHNVLDGGIYKASDFTNPTFMEEKADNLMSLLIDMEIYLKRQSWFFANFLCSICNPLNHKYFTPTANGMNLKVNMSTCSDIMEMKDFEIRLHDLYSNFVSKLANFVACKSPEYISQLIPYENNAIEIQKQDLKECYKPNFKLNDPHCQNTCSKSISHYKFPMKIFSSAGVALKIIYEYLTKRPIARFYKNVKKREFLEDDISGDNSIEFYTVNNEAFKKLKMLNLKWTISAENGISIFTDHMSKRYTSKAYMGEVGLILMALVLIFIR